MPNAGSFLSVLIGQEEACQGKDEVMLLLVIVVTGFDGTRPIELL